MTRTSKPHARRARRALFICAALVVSACGSDDTSSGSDEPTESTSEDNAASSGTDAKPEWGEDAGTDTEAAEGTDAPVIEAPEGAAPSKLVTEDLTVGEGAEITAGSFVAMNYIGALYANGQVFDSSYRRNEPFTVSIGAGQVIKGWDEGLVGMRQGGRRRLVIPADMAYGDDGAGEDIPPGATLIFVVDAVFVGQKPAATAATAPGDEVVVTETRPGTGEPAAKGDTINLLYVGSLLDGKEFDSNWGVQLLPVALDADPPQTIEGFNEGLRGVTAGSQRQIVVPAAKGYGDQEQADGAIPANSDLVFLVDVVSITRGDG